MCTFPTHPPSLTFYWPWQAPVNWLLVGVLWVLYGAAVFINFRRLPPTLPVRQREVIVGIACAGFALALASVALLGTVIPPSWDALLNWRRNVAPWVIEHQCAAQLDAMEDPLSSSYGNLVGIALAGSFAGFIIGSLALAAPDFVAANQQRFARLRRWWETRRAHG